MNDINNFGLDSNIKVVQNVSRGLAEDGSEVYRISGYDQGNPYNRLTRPGANGVTAAETVSNGDLVQFTLDFEGQINKLSRLSPLPTDGKYYLTGKGSRKELIYGMAYSTISKYLSSVSTQYEQRLVISLDKEGTDLCYYSLLTDSGSAPDIYTYSRKTGKYYVSDFNDILSSVSVGDEDASDVFLYASDEVVKAVIIIND